MRVSEPIEDDSSSQADSESSQEDMVSEENRIGSEDDASSSGSESEASQVSALELKRSAVLLHRLTKGPPQGAQIPFEQLLQQRQEGSLASKPYTVHKHSRQQSAGSSKAGSSKAGSSKAGSSKAGSGKAANDFRRQNKNRPVEQSSKRPVPRHRQVVEVSNRYLPAIIVLSPSIGCCGSDPQTLSILQ